MIPSIKKSLIEFKDFEFFILTFDHSKKLVSEMLNI